MRTVVSHTIYSQRFPGPGVYSINMTSKQSRMMGSVRSTSDVSTLVAVAVAVEKMNCMTFINTSSDARSWDTSENELSQIHRRTVSSLRIILRTVYTNERNIFQDL
ncbi:hypothetical protein AVEN_132090-1 [Araneus ventricosus]|uniref:Uncharacterized protein n=1 Tax=Araneus ventricosus TaxID=182803 RepID=A0A4Y2FB09_ARAVE|nr:hypothetical protein AVEN_132090-1 [Araneus ventricosus]